MAFDFRSAAAWMASFVLLAALLSLSSPTHAQNCPITTIEYGATRTGTLSNTDCVATDSSNGNRYYVDLYGFAGKAGDRVAITNNSSAFNADLTLYLPDNNTFIYDDNGGGGTNSRIPASSGFYTLPTTGNYTIWISSALPLQTGAYTMTLTAASVPASCAVAASPQSSATLPLAAGTSVTLSAACGSGATPITFTWDNGAFTGASRTVTPTQTTTYSVVPSNANGSAAPLTITVFVAAAPPPPATVPTIEFYNTYLLHYFVTAVQAEATAIDNGSAGAGWVRTGFSYDVYPNPVNAGGISTVPVCRFYGTPGKGPNSHFYTADAGECEQVKKDPGWTYEGIAYHIQAPTGGACPSGTQSIFRVYNNLAAQNDSNHRFINNGATFLQMADRGWTTEGVVMCTANVRAPTPVTGGTFKDPAGSGAGMTIANGELPGYVNATQPQTSQTRPGSLPPGMTNPGAGDTNVTTGTGGGYDFNLTGDGGFTTTTTGAVSISVPFNAAAIPPGDLNNPMKTFVRVAHPDGSTVDLAGDVTVNGASGLMTVPTQGLPNQFTASVVYNPNMDGDAAEVGTFEQGQFVKSATATTWPGQGWCVIYNSKDPAVIQAVQTVLGITRAPTTAEIKSVVRDRVVRYATLAQAAMQNDNMAAPNMGQGKACGGVNRYYLHLVSRPQGSGFKPDDPGAAVNETGRHYGRLYIDPSRMADPQSSELGTSLASIAHEMLHAVQNGYRILGLTPRAYREGAAAVYGKTVDTGGAVKVRSETAMLSSELLDPTPGGTNAYGSQDFWAYMANAYNGGKLNYMSSFYGVLRGALGANANNPSRTILYNTFDTWTQTTFKKTLGDAYMEFVRDRALTHPPAAQLRPGENTNGLSVALFPNANVTRNIDMTTCSKTAVSLQGSNFPPFSSAAISLAPAAALPANSVGVTLQVRVTPTNGAMGTAWKGWSYRNGVASAMTQTTTKIGGWGKAGDPLVLIVSNLDKTNAAGFTMEINCGGPQIDSLSPSRGNSGTVVTINGSGFGAQADPRSVTFNGVAATTVTYVSDTQIRATVPANASTGDVIVTVNGEKSNGANFEVVAACSSQQIPGGDTPDTRTIELGRTSGSFSFSYDTYVQEDRIIVRYQGNTLFDTGCVGAAGNRTLNFSGSQSFITVQVIPNCRVGTGTQWVYSVGCANAGDRLP